RIRRAISLYLNRKQAVDYAYQGAAAVSGIIYPRYSRLEIYFEDMADTIKKLRIIDYDAQAADTLMKEAGAVKDGSGIWTLNGQQIGGDLYYPVSLDAVAPIIAEQL